MYSVQQPFMFQNVNSFKTPGVFDNNFIPSTTAPPADSHLNEVAKEF
jgi:hypothetical protein